ncbi:hypothetical protein Angca_005076, partial [Angiostrongylus cantonensis]
SREPIHSGHFMTSNPHTEPQPDDEDEDVEVGFTKVDVVEDGEKTDDIGAGTSKVERAALYEKPVTFYKFGPKKTQSIAIDVSLNKLNKCIKVAYNKMTTPKWKDFKGLRLHWKQRIRLNNVIWRAYYIEFRRPTKKAKKKTPFCYFTVPDDDTTHSKIEGSLLEGMHWKRRIEAVCTQNKRWRHYMKPRRAQEKPLKRRRVYLKSQIPETTSTDYNDFDDLENVFTDSLFESLNQPYMFPYPKEFVQSGNADIMQPGLLSLQPSLEEIMASLGSRESSSAPRPAQDYAVANMLVDYSNQPSTSMQMPTRQPSLITSQMVMMSSLHTNQPQYSTASVYNSVPHVSPPQRSANDSHISFIHIFTFPQIPMGCQPSTPARPWWLDSPLSATAQSPLTAVAPSINGGNITSLGPSTPLGIGTVAEFYLAKFDRLSSVIMFFLLISSTTGPNTPSSLLRSELRSPVVVRTMPIQLSPDMPTILSSPSTLISIDSQQSLNRNTHTTVNHRSSGSRSESQTLPVTKVLPKHDWISSLSTNITTPNVVDSGQMQIRSAPPSAMAPDSTLHPEERKRILHLHAEQNRRSALKDGFDMLMDMIPDLHSGGVKPTNAVVLAKGAEYIRHLTALKNEQSSQKVALIEKIAKLNQRIGALQSNLPSSSGVTSTKLEPRAALEAFYDRYIKESSRKDYRFWVV